MENKVYFGSSVCIGKVRSEMLEKNRKVLIDVMYYLHTYLTKTKDIRFPLSEISHILRKIKRTGQSNTLFEKDVRKIVAFLQKNTGDKVIEQNLHGDNLVDYMYDLSNFYYFNFYDITKLRNMISSNGKYDDEVNSIDMEMSKKMYANGLRYPRSQKFSIQCIIHADFLCEVDSSHMFFKSTTTNKNYVEAHHLIPLSYQYKFEKSLDTLGNLVSLCVVCHKKIHHGALEDKKDTLTYLYNYRKDQLENYGIDQNEFFDLYKRDISEDY